MTMKKYMMIFMVLGFSIIKVNAQTEQANNSANVVTADTNDVEYLVELNDKSTITGKKVSDDGREIGILTADKGLILIPKYQIKSISSVA